MKKLYKKPSLIIESFISDSDICANGTRTNALSYHSNLNQADFGAPKNAIHFDKNDANVLNSINYTDFLN